MSEVVSLHCPKCGQKLKIKDRALFGKKVKCPDCKQSFVLHDPDGTTPAPQPPAPSPAMENPQPTAAPAPIAPKPANPFDFTAAPVEADNPFASMPPAPRAAAPLPPATNPFGPPPAASVSNNPFAPTPQVSAPTNPLFAPPPAAPPSAASPIPTGPIPANPLSAGTPLGIPADEPIKSARKKKSQSNWTGMAAGIVGFLVLAGGGGYFLSQQSGPQPLPKPQASDGVVALADEDNHATADGVYSKRRLQDNPELIAEFTPTKGQPIELLMVPSGANLVIHLRPALLWSDDYAYRVLRASLTDEVTNWLAQQIKTYCRRDPQQIEEVVFAIILGSRGMEPQVCTVVHLKEPTKLTSLIEEFPGKYLFDISEKPDLRVKVDDKHGVYIRDDKTFAICPASLASEFEFWAKTPNYEVTEGITDQLKKSDRDRLFTAIATVSDLDIHLKSLFPKSAQPLVSALVEWIGPDVETVGWSFHPEPYLHSQVWLRPTTVKSAATLETEFQNRLENLPERVWKELCNKMHPNELRFRKLIGRLPAMLEASQQSTVAQHAGRSVVLTTVLPAKATPNLALAALFTVNEAARTNFAAAPVAASSGKAALPPTIAGRLELPVEAEFARTPLEQALQFLCDEVQVKLHVDGDGLKDAGYTKNMPQTFNLGKVPMRQALSTIIDNYQERGKEMVACFDESKMLITVTTRKFAERDGLKVSLPVPK